MFKSILFAVVAVVIAVAVWRKVAHALQTSRLLRARKLIRAETIHVTVLATCDTLSEAARTVLECHSQAMRANMIFYVVVMKRRRTSSDAITVGVLRDRFMGHLEKASRLGLLGNTADIQASLSFLHHTLVTITPEGVDKTLQLARRVRRQHSGAFFLLVLSGVVMVRGWDEKLLSCLRECQYQNQRQNRGRHSDGGGGGGGGSGESVVITTLPEDGAAVARGAHPEMQRSVQSTFQPGTYVFAPVDEPVPLLPRRLHVRPRPGSKELLLGAETTPAIAWCPALSFSAQELPETCIADWCKRERTPSIHHPIVKIASLSDVLWRRFCTDLRMQRLGAATRMDHIGIVNIDDSHEVLLKMQSKEEALSVFHDVA